MVKHIYFLSPVWKNPKTDEVSGGTKSNLALLKVLSKIMPVSVYTTSEPKIIANQIKTKRIQFINFPIPRRVIPVFSNSYFAKFIKIKALCRGDIIIATRSLIPLGRYIAHVYKCNFVIICRDFSDFQSSERNNTKDLPWITRKALQFQSIQIRAAYKKADLIITNSDFMKNNIASKQNIDRKKIIVITPKVENFDIEPVIRPDKLKTIGFINKGERKGSSIIRKLATQNPNWKFVVFGQNLLENDKTTLENVDNRGFENLEKVIYNSVDIFLVPSEWDEPFGRVPVEALLHECPVLVSSKGGLPESVFNETKLIVKDGSIVEWEKEINDVFLNYAKYIKLCHKLQQKIGKRNSKSDFNLIKAFEKL